MQIIFFFLLPLPLACEMASDATAIQKLNTLRNEKFGPAIDKQMKIIRDSQTLTTEAKQATEMLRLQVQVRNEWIPLLEYEVGKSDAKKGDVGKLYIQYTIDEIVDERNVIVAAKNGLYWIEGIPTAKMKVRFPVRCDYYFFVCEGTRKYGRDDVKWFKVVKSFKEDSATLRLDNK